MQDTAKKLYVFTAIKCKLLAVSLLSYIHYPIIIIIIIVSKYRMIRMCPVFLCGMVNNINIVKYYWRWSAVRTATMDTVRIFFLFPFLLLGYLHHHHHRLDDYDPRSGHIIYILKIRVNGITNIPYKGKWAWNWQWVAYDTCDYFELDRQSAWFRHYLLLTQRSYKAASVLRSLLHCRIKKKRWMSMCVLSDWHPPITAWMTPNV